MSRLVKIALVSALAAWCAEATAQRGVFVDPTRPPDVAAEIGGSAPAGTRLQSVLIGPRRRVAVIDGQRVTVGGRYGDATVVRITEGEVVLKRGGGIRPLKLLPGVDKVRRKHGRAKEDRK